MTHFAFRITALAIALSTSGFVQAQAPKKELTPQQKRMGECAHEAKGKKGDEYRKSMSECLKSKKDAPAPASNSQTAPAAAKTAGSASAPAVQAQAASPRDKMKTCNAQAKEKALKGDARKSFMSDCLKG